MKNLNDYNGKDADEFCIRDHRNEQNFTDLKKETVGNKTLVKKIDSLGFKSMTYLGKSDIDFLADVDDGEERPENYSLENASNTLKQLAKQGKCSIPQYNQPNERVHDEGNP